MSSLNAKRRSDFVRPLPEDFQVSPRDAFLDRIEVSIGEWLLNGTERQIVDGLNSFREQTIEGNDGHSINLFRPGLSTSLRSQPQVVFSSSVGRDQLSQTEPLVSGRLAWSPKHRPSQLTATPRILFYASINLTRFVQAQRIARYSRLDRPRLHSGISLVSTPSKDWFRFETPLSPATNLIAGPDRKFGYATRYTAAEHLTRYLRELDHLLENCVASSLGEVEVATKREKYYSLREIEIYWDFDVPSPIDFVVSITPKLRTLSHKIFEGAVPMPPSEQSIAYQSPSIKVQLAKGTTLKVYAKTDRRVRFEVTLDQAALSKHLGARTSKTRHSLVKKTEPIVRIAARELNAVLPIIMADSPAPSTLSTTELLFEIVRCSENQYIAETIVSSLVCFDRVAPYANDPVKASVHKLRDAGVLRPVKPRSRNYCVTDPYRGPLERLKSMR